MFPISTRRALLGLLFSFLAVQIVQASVDLRLLPKVEKNEQVNEEGSIEQIGIEIERVGPADDPMEGSNVTLICSYFALSSTLKSIDPPTWYFYGNGKATWHKFSFDFLKEPNAGI
jgi:hypothetical protein